MQAILKINGIDFSHWIKEDGLQYGESYRQEREVVTLDGIMHRNRIKKMTISVELVELRDKTLQMLKGALLDLSEVEATNTEGVSITGSFYITDFSTSAKTVRGGNTYYSGTSFELEAQ